MKVLLIILLFGCAALGLLAIVNTIRLNKLQRKSKRKIYHTPRLSDLHGKDFTAYIDYLTQDLH